MSLLTPGEARENPEAGLLENLEAEEELPQQGRPREAGSRTDGNLPGSCIRPGSGEAVRGVLRELVGGESSLVRRLGSRLEEGGQHRGCKEMARAEEEQQSRWACRHV